MADADTVDSYQIVIMVALYDHYIFVLWFLSFFFSSPNLSGRSP